MEKSEFIDIKIIASKKIRITQKAKKKSINIKYHIGSTLLKEAQIPIGESVIIQVDIARNKMRIKLGSNGYKICVQSNRNGILGTPYVNYEAVEGMPYMDFDKALKCSVLVDDILVKKGEITFSLPHKLVIAKCLG